MKRVLLITLLTLSPNVLKAQDPPYIIGPDGGLYQGIDPEVYLEGGQTKPPVIYQWCFWPIGCLDDEEIVQIEPGPNFDSHELLTDRYRKLRDQPDFNIELLPIPPENVPMPIR